MDTRHGRARAAQRGFTADLIEVIRRYGTFDGDRQIMGRREIAACIQDINAFRSRLLKLMDKGGGTAVFRADDALITVFSPQTYHQPSRGRRPTRLQSA